METVILKSFFRTFFSEVPIADQEFLKIQYYLFSVNAQLPTFPNSRLLMVIEGLKEVIEENSFDCIEDLHRYYYNKVEQIDTFLNELELESSLDKSNNLRSSSIHFDGCRNKFVAWSASTAKNNSLPLNRNEYLHCVRSYYAHTFAETLRNKFVHYKSFRIYLQGSFQVSTKLSHKCEIDNLETSLNLTRYFEGFSKDCNKELVVLVGRQDDSINKSQFQSCITNLDNNLSRPQNYLSVLFDSIMQKIQKEVSIFNSAFKEQLAIWLSFSKGVSSLSESEHQSTLKTYYLDVYNRSKSVLKNEKLPTINVDRQLYYTLLALKHWVILKSPHGHSWLTSDNPGFSINPERINLGVIGFQADPTWQNIKSDSVIYYPLSNKYCLKLQSENIENMNSALPIKEVIQFEESTTEELQVVNGLTFSTKHRMLVAGDEKPLEQFEMV